MSVQLGKQLWENYRHLVPDAENLLARPFRRGEYDLPISNVFSGHRELITRDKLAFFEQCERQGPVVRLRVYQIPVYIVSNPRLIEQVLVDDHDSFIKTIGVRTAAARMFGQGLLSSEHNLWRRQHEVMQPYFQPKRIPNYVPTILECGRELLASLKPGQERTLDQDATLVTLKGACLSLFGQAAWAVRDTIMRATQSVQVYFRAWEQWGFLPGFELLPLREVREYKSAIEALDVALYGLIEQNRVQGSTDDNLLSQMVRHRDEVGTPMSDRQIRDELVTLILAAYETTAFLLACTLHMVSTRPEVLRKVREEARVLSDGFDPSTFSIRSLPYMHSVVREALRICPPVPVIGREAIAPVRLGGVDIEPGAQVIMSAWAVHRSERHFDRPLEFLPERWKAGADTDLPRYGFFPFGGGPRVCIGQHLAVPEVMLLASMLLGRVTFSEIAGCEPQLEPLLTMIYKHGTMRMRVDTVAA